MNANFELDFQVGCLWDFNSLCMFFAGLGLSERFTLTKPSDSNVSYKSMAVVKARKKLLYVGSNCF